MDTDNLLRATRKFIARFVCPMEIRTDNAAQIKMMADVTKEARFQKHQYGAAKLFPMYVFIAVMSPWSGGMYERMVALYKRCFVRSGSARSVLDVEDFLVLLQESEAVINDRPLTYVSNDDISPIRPVDLVFPNKRSNFLLTVEETLDFSDMPSTHEVLLENWQRTSSLTEHFTARWKEEYVQVLQSRTHKGTSTTCKFGIVYKFHHRLIPV